MKNIQKVYPKNYLIFKYFAWKERTIEEENNGRVKI